MDLSKAIALDVKNIDRLIEGLRAMGFNVTKTGLGLIFAGVHKATGLYHSGSFTNGELKYTGNLEVNAVKRAYSEAVVKKQFGNMGKLKQIAPNKFVVQLKTA